MSEGRTGVSGCRSQGEDPEPYQRGSSAVDGEPRCRSGNGPAGPADQGVTPARWIAISGSWRQPTARVLADVRAAVDRLLAAGHGVVTGGALGVDFAATAVVLEAGLAPERLQVLLPTDLTTYATHYRRRAARG